MSTIAPADEPGPALTATGHQEADSSTDERGDYAARKLGDLDTAPVEPSSSRGRRPGRRPEAIVYDDHTIHITVIAFYGPPLAAVVEQIEAAIRPLIGTRRLSITIDDLDTSPGGGPSLR